MNVCGPDSSLAIEGLHGCRIFTVKRLGSTIRTTSDAEGEDEALAVPANSESYAASGLGAALASDAQAVLQAAAAGPQTATAHFAEWESHTRGIGSALMAQMGYVSGSGLGMEGTGCVNPVHMQPLRTKAGLGNEASLADSAPHAKRKRKRGGERNARRKKAADHMQARSIAKDEEQATELTTGHAGIFAFINGNLGDSSVAAGELRRRHSSTSSEPVLKDWQLHMKQQKQRPPSSVQPQVAAGTAGSAPASDKAASQRQALASSQDTITALQQKVKHYTQMAARNAGDRTIHEQVKVKLKRAKDELAKAEASQIAAHSAIHAQEKQKKWMKF